jgi:membrane protease YdiL (CAAX protease family)
LQLNIDDEIGGIFARTYVFTGTEPLSQNLSDKAMAMYFASDDAKRIEQFTLQKKSAKARRPLRWIATVQTLLLLVLYPALNRAWEHGDHFAAQLEVALGALAVAYWAIWIWSFSNPLPAAMVGLLLMTSLSYASSAAYGTEYKHGPPPSVGIVTIIDIILLTRAIMAGSRQRRMEIADNTDGAVPRGIASGIWLYLVLLSIVVIPLSLAADQEFDFNDFFKIQNFMAIVTVTWAAIAWRDTLPVYRRFGDAQWYGIAIFIGVATSLFASVYLPLLDVVFGIRATNNVEAPFFDHGYGWLTVIGSIAVFPAIFEEMAFRGVIVPCLHRALTEKETIAVTAIMFMVLHLSVFSAPHLLILGCALAYVRLRSGSIWPCVLMHFVHNAMVLAMDRFF